MKRQIFLGLTGAVIVGLGLALGACNKHSLKDGEFDKGVKNLYKHHGDDAHGDGHGHDHGDEAGHGDHKGHDHGEHKGHDHGDQEGQATPKETKQKAPAKTLFPKE